MPVDEFARYDYAWKIAGWSVQNPTLVTTAVDTYYDPGLPNDISKVLVSYDAIEMSTGRELEGVLSLRTTAVLEYTTLSQQVMPGIKKFRFKGALSILLPATNSVLLTPSGWNYHAHLQVGGYAQEWEFLLPAIPDTVNLLDLIPAA